MLILVMKIAHLQFRDMMECSLSYPQLVELAATSKRYDTNQILAPFLQRWCQVYRNRILSPGMEGWLYVACQFGLEEDYVLLARHLVLNCMVDKDGELRTPVGHQFHGRFPTGALDRIKQQRRDLLINLLNTTYGHLEDMVDRNTCQCPSTHQSNAGSTPPLVLESSASLPNSTHSNHHISDTDRTNCTLLNYGTLVQKLKSLGYWPVLRTTSCMRDSVTSVANLLSSIKVLACPSDENEPSTSSQADSSTSRLAIPPTPVNAGVKLSSAHAHCDAGLRLATKIQAVIRGVENTVDDHTMLEVRQNRRKYASWPQNARAKNWGVSYVRIPAPMAGLGSGSGAGLPAGDPEKREYRGQRQETEKECRSGSESGRRGSLCPWFNINQDIEQ
ncbi:hypothetical protein BCR34DRAFT_561868 [Clohesyomyces aquaticus]|uniref:Uncharacterized protein n=1 Tax=Clohesyomyces aquaticus TaxID=1231657 RepID=A0A1Y1ZTV1_9PLEO|nr:hypothetical protein BCR34DRAFT_561868 [Clohesyomyces aquaticus]